MMRRFMVFGFILCLVSVCNAGLEWTVTGSTAGTGNAFDVMPGDAVTMVLNATEDTQAVGVVIGVITDNRADGGFTDYDFNPAFTISGKPDEWDIRFPFELPFICTGCPWPPYLDGDDLVWIEGASPDIAVTDDILTLYYTVGNNKGNVTITAEGDFTGLLPHLGDIVSTLQGNIEMPVISLNVIPEPISFTLLGLGGVLLRFRKK